jgi:hypothetical protein
MDNPMILNKAMLIAFIYFFVNSLFLPHGLLYTTILAPLLFLTFSPKNQIKYIQFLGIFLIPFSAIHIYNGVSLLSFLISTALLVCSMVFIAAFRTYLIRHQDIEPIFKKITNYNFALFLVAIVVFLSPWKEILWHLKPLTINISSFPRLNLLTYEPSYYSTLLVPIVLYYTLKAILFKDKTKKVVPSILLIGIPLIFSFSFGVLACIIFAIFIFILFYNLRILKKRAFYYFISTTTFIIIIGLIALFILYPDNVVFQRISDIISGQDTSAKGRTYQALKMAYLIAEEKSILFGAGLGQIKYVGEHIIRDYYNYNVADIPTLRIPSSIGETLASFGLVGLILRLGFQFYFFIKSKTYNNYYRCIIFIYIFIYQFTGSYLTNIAEYVLWVIAFTPAFPEFNLSSKKEVIKI